jgi:hypothetical protein
MKLKIAMALTVCVATIYSTPLVKAQKICYQVLIDDGSLDNTEESQFASLQEVAKNYKLHTGQNLDTTQIFVDADIYFQYRTKRKIYYCEKVKIVIDKKGNKKYKRIKKKELYNCTKPQLTSR